MAAPEAKLAKLLTAMQLMPYWPNLRDQCGVRTIDDLAVLSDAQLKQHCQLKAVPLRKLRSALDRWTERRAQRASQTNVHPSNPFGAPPSRSASAHSSASSSTRVLNFSGGAVPRAQAPVAPGRAKRPAPQVKKLSWEPEPAAAAAPRRPPKKNSADVLKQRAKRQSLRFKPEDELKNMYHEGWITKVGGKRKTWNRRFMVLRNDATLSYSAPSSMSTCKGVIDLQSATAVNGPNECNWVLPGMPSQAIPELRFEVVLPDRTYCFFAESSSEAAAWARKIRQAVKVGPQRMGPNGPRSDKEVMEGNGFQNMLVQLAGSTAD